MANLKEIRKRINSVQSTKKITNAMAMISASKLYQARKSITQSRDYNLGLKKIVTQLSKKAPTHLEKFLLKAQAQKTAVLLFTSDKGLCGALNSSLCKQVSILTEKDKSAVDFFIIGKKGRDFFTAKGVVIKDGYYSLKEKELKAVVPKLAETLINLFSKKEYGEIYIAYNYFKNALQQDPIIKKLLPLELDLESNTTDEEVVQQNEYIYEPSVEQISSQVVPLYLENLCYLSLLDSFACEHAARMRVMDSATKNATDLIGKLQVQYNRARQANITTELTEIISGAEAIK